MNMQTRESRHLMPQVTADAPRSSCECSSSVRADSECIGAESAAAAYFRNSYAVLVQGRTVRRHLYFNLPAATRAVERAHARGDVAELALVRLVPVDGRGLDLDPEVVGEC